MLLKGLEAFQRGRTSEAAVGFCGWWVVRRIVTAYYGEQPNVNQTRRWGNCSQGRREHLGPLAVG